MVISIALCNQLFELLEPIPLVIKVKDGIPLLKIPLLSTLPIKD